MAGALEGLRVLDCTHVIAGAWCSMVLADLGADVVKIEPPSGETTRGHPGAAFRAFDFVNRNKRAIALGVNNQRLWLRFLEALGAPELDDDERFGRPNRRVRRRDELQEKIEAILARDTTANWMAKLEAVGVPAGPLNDIASAWDDPQVKARGLLAEAGYSSAEIEALLASGAAASERKDAA